MRNVCDHLCHKKPPYGIGRFVMYSPQNAFVEENLNLFFNFPGK